jgi:CheY-like chemotaxis protein
MKNRVLLVAEDDPDDQMLVQDALNTLPTDLDLRFVEDGHELMAYLYENGGENPPPGLILLDLNMPGKDGRTALREIKGDPSLAHIPVVILTTSKAEEDTRYCLGFGVDDYYRKPSSFKELAQILDQVVSEHM